MKKVFHCVPLQREPAPLGPRLLSCRDLVPINCQKCSDRHGDDIPGREDENGCGDSIAVERDEESADCLRGRTRFRSLLWPVRARLVFVNSLDYRCSRHLLLNGSHRDATFSPRYSLLAKGKAECCNAGCGNEIAQRIFVTIRNHEAFRTAFSPKGF